jgi:hypothetical protein
MSGIPTGWTVEEYTEVLPRPGGLPFSYNFVRQSWRVKDEAGNLVYAGAYEQNARQQSQALHESS